MNDYYLHAVDSNSTVTKLQHQIHGDLRFSKKTCVIMEKEGNLSQPNSSQ